MRTNILALAALLAFSSAAAEAESYSGKWEAAGQSVRQRGKCPDFLAHITVAGKQISIGITGGATLRLNGTVAPDGSFTAVGVAGATTASGKFVDDTVEFTLEASCGARTATGHRAG